MQIQQVMTSNVHYIPSSCTIAQAASKMREIDSGFLPIADSPEGRLQGVVTDRDIVVRAIAAGKDPQQATVSDAKTDKILYCFKDDPVEDAVNSMRDQQVYRLIVLDNHEDKRVCGVVSLGDIVGNHREQLGGEAVRDITSTTH